MKPPEARKLAVRHTSLTARKLAVRHTSLTASFLATGGFKF